jgi:hypothetical protein
MLETEGSPYTDPSGIRQDRANATDSAQRCRVLLRRGGIVQEHRPTQRFLSLKICVLDSVLEERSIELEPVIGCAVG